MASAVTCALPQPVSSTGSRTVCFLLISGFALMSYASVVEPLRAANRLSGRALYRWRHATPDSQPACCSAGLTIAPDVRPGELGFDTVIVVAASDAAVFHDPACLGWLRRLARQGVKIGGVSGGPFVLARAGLLDGHRCTVHWDHQAAFVEQFPKLEVSEALYELDGTRFTCAGGTAGLDMINAVIAAEYGDRLAAAVGDWFLSGQLRVGHRPQRMDIRLRYRVSNPRIVAVLARMEATLEEPCSGTHLARVAGVSVRQLERLFRKELGFTMREHYARLRLDRARALLTEAAMPIREVAVACGFANANHFSVLFRRRFGFPPSKARNLWG